MSLRLTYVFKPLLAVVLCAAMPVSLYCEDNGYKIMYDGGSLSGIKAGTSVKLYVDQQSIAVDWKKTELVKLRPASITEISYGQDVHRRVGAAVGIGVVTLGVGALMALSKSKKHFIGLTWEDNGSKGGFAFQADKKNYRGILAGLEGVTGKNAVDSDTMKVKN